MTQLTAQLSAAQRQTLMAEARLSAVSEQIEQRQNVKLEAWQSNPNRWALPLPEGAKDPADQILHRSEIARLSWMFPRTTRQYLPEEFWILLDRLWGVAQIDQWPLKMTPVQVTAPATMDDPITVRFQETDLEWGQALLELMELALEHLETTPQEQAKVDRVCRNLATRLHALKIFLMRS